MTRDACRHPTTEPLGHQGDAFYERCRACGRILIFQRGQAWVLRPVLPAA